MKNNIKKVSIHSAFFIFFLGVCINAKSEGILTVSYRPGDTEERRNIEDTNSLIGFSDRCNILLCEERKYVNCFYPISTTRESQCFWEVFNRKIGRENFSVDVLMGKSGSFDEQRELLLSYVQMAKCYLETMRHFYPQTGAWVNAQNGANAVFDDVMNWELQDQN